uniref:Uncharacterized protein n=1 Tax=Rhizophora mucronata TaxID=61149 RepID=A0A2P2PES2_RHIMU
MYWWMNFLLPGLLSLDWTS